MSLLNNAVSAIQVGIEDFQSNDDRRQLSAIRNIHAGILLLCKVKLQIESPNGSDEVLLKQRILPHKQTDGSVIFKGDGKKTADQQQIQERLTNLGVKLDWNRLTNVTNIRNNVEHYFFSGSRQHIREAVAESCVVIRQLVMDVLEKDPANLIGADYWKQLFKVKEVYDHELRACRQSLAGVKWKPSTTAVFGSDFQCPECESKLFGQVDSRNDHPEEVQFRCTNCGARLEGDEGLERILEERYAGESFLAAKGDIEAPLEDCPECQRHSYVTEQSACAICGFEMPDDAECAVCGEPLSVEDYEEHGSLCSYHAYVMERERDR
ncbi:MAG: hypothetical protein AB7O80_06145 [Acetobacteraceae bacterium]